MLIAPTPLPILAPLLPYFGTDVDATATMAETKKPTVRFAIPKKPKKRPPFSVRRVYSAILLVMGFVRMGRDRAGLVRDAVGTGKGLARRAPGEDAVALRRGLWEKWRIEAPVIERPEGLLIRASTHFYNTEDEVDRLTQALTELLPEASLAKR